MSSADLARPDLGHSLFETPAVIGHREELERLRGVLHQGTASVVVVSGPAGAGKTPLLARLRAEAVTMSWSVVGPVRITPASTPDTLIEPLTAFPAQRLDRPDQLLGRRLDSGAVGQQRAAEAASPLIASLRRRVPLLLVIDDYQPSPDFDEWFAERFLPPQLMDLDLALAVVVATRPGNEPKIEGIPNVLIPVMPLSNDHLLRYFVGIGDLLSPPARPQEVKAWVEAVQAKPALIDPLVRSLAFAYDDLASSET